VRLVVLFAWRAMPYWPHALVVGQFPIEKEFYHNNPQCRPDNWQGVDQFENVFPHETKVMDQETGKLHSGLVQPVKN